MSIHTLLIYIIASIFLSILLQEIEKYTKLSILDKIILPNIYLLVLAGMFTTYHIADNHIIFFIILFQILGKIFYQNIILEVPISSTANFPYQTELLTLITAYLLNNLLINQIDNIFLKEEELKLFIWVLVSAYLFSKIKNYRFPPIWKETKKSHYQSNDYIVMQYAKFKSQYSNRIHPKHQCLIPIIYAVMIYENYQTPSLLRRFAQWKYKLDHRPRKFGIMQIYSRRILTDEESIQISISKLENCYAKVQRGKKTPRNKIPLLIIQTYYHRRNIPEIWKIYKQIIYFDKL